MDYGLNVHTVIYYYNIKIKVHPNYQINYNLYIYSIYLFGGWRIIMSRILVYYSNNNKVLLNIIFIPKEISLNAWTLLMCREREREYCECQRRILIDLKFKKKNLIIL